MDKVKVLVVDDHDVVREGIRMVLSSDPELEVVGTARNGEEAVERAHELHPDVVVMDIGMPGLSGFEATRQSPLTPSPTSTSSRSRCTTARPTSSRCCRRGRPAT